MFLIRQLKQFVFGFRDARKIAGQQAEYEKDKAERRKIAEAFNYRYTYMAVFPPLSADELKHPRLKNFKDGATSAWRAWMCPTCQQIHRPLEFSFWIGVVYPRCCEFPAGERHNKKWGYLRKDFPKYRDQDRNDPYWKRADSVYSLRFTVTTPHEKMDSLTN